MKLQGPENHAGLAHGADTYAPDAEGLIEIPDHLAEIAFSHGFTLVESPAADKSVKKPKEK